MVTLIRWLGRVVCLGILALYVVGIASIFVRADDDAKLKAKAALAIAIAKQEPQAIADRPARTPEQSAKAALAIALGKACDCGLCDKAKPMPPAVPPSAEAKPKAERTVEKLSYAELTKAVAALKPGESLRVYVGQKAVEAATGRLVELTGTIPGEEQIVGVWRWWVEDGKPTMQPQHGDDRPARVVIAGRYYDRYADGSLFWCVECNRGR